MSKIPKFVAEPKMFHGRHDGTTEYGPGRCHECGEKRRIAVFTAELNLGEWYTADICADCLEYHASRLRADKPPAD